MSRRPLFLSLALGALLLAPGAQAASSAEADPYEATVTKTVNRVDWQRARKNRWQKASTDTVLFVGDSLRTGADAKAELLYGDGSVTRVGSLTVMTLTGDQRRELRLDSGRVWLHIQKGGAGMRVITPGAVAAVTGTELMVEFDPVKRSTDVTVFEGSVNVTSDVGNMVRVLGGTSTLVPFRAPAAAPVPLDNSKVQERDAIFKPLAVPEAKPPANGSTGEPKQAEPKQGEPKQGESSQSEPKQGETTTAPETQGNQTGEPTTGDSTASAPTDAGSSPAPAPAPAPNADKAPMAPNLQDETKRIGDPRYINGSPVHGQLKVIIQ